MKIAVCIKAVPDTETKAKIAADGRSPLATAFLALDGVLDVMGAGKAVEQIGLGDLLPVRSEKLRGRLVTRVALPLNARLAYESVARTPADLPIVCAATSSANLASHSCRCPERCLSAVCVLMVSSPGSGRGVTLDPWRRVTRRTARASGTSPAAR